MPVLVLLGLVGFGAQFINTGLGMGYGVTSATALLAIGASPALAAATVNFSQVGSQLVAGAAHWRLGLPGAAGAFAGATFLSWLAAAVAGPLMATILLALGAYLLVRFTVWGTPRGRPGRPLRSRFLAPLGLVGGFLNATGGGGWGPVGTSALLASGRVTPRTAIGSITASELAVVVAGSAGFLLGLGLAGVNLPWVLMMLVGGVLAAPVAAWTTARIPSRLLGSLVGGLIVVVNAYRLFLTSLAGVPPVVPVVTFTLLGLAWAGAIGWSFRAHRASRAAAHATMAA